MDGRADDLTGKLGIYSYFMALCTFSYRKLKSKIKLKKKSYGESLGARLLHSAQKYPYLKARRKALFQAT